ncbi:MAG: spore maturation protein [Clostridia bacterium]
MFFKNPDTIFPTMFASATETISLCIELCAVYTIWLGILELIDKSGLALLLAKLLGPLIKKLFKTADAETEKLIAVNISANMLGLGNAATPSGIKAITKLDNKSGVASPGMIMLLVINACSIQLIPSTTIGLRTTAGSNYPADIILPTLISSFIATGTAILLVILCQKFVNRAHK